MVVIYYANRTYLIFKSLLELVFPPNWNIALVKFENILIILKMTWQSWIYIFFFFVHRNRRGSSDQPYDWGQDLWVRRCLMKPICARKNLGQWEQGMVAVVANVAVPFLSFLHSSVAALLLCSQTFAPRLTTSRHLSLSCARYSR